MKSFHPTLMSGILWNKCKIMIWWFRLDDDIVKVIDNGSNDIEKTENGKEEKDNSTNKTMEGNENSKGMINA